MARYATHITVLLCVAIVAVGAPFSIRAIREPVAPVVVPDDKPVVDTFAVDLRAAFDKLNPDQQQAIRDHALSIIALCGMEGAANIKNTKQLFSVFDTARMAVYGTVDPIADPAINHVLFVEAVKRGLLNPDTDSDDSPDEYKAFDPALWSEFYTEVGGVVQ